MMRRKTDKLIVFCTVLCILCAGVVAVVSWTVLDTKSATQQIQAERAENIRRNCQDTNDRYTKTVHELDRLLAVRTRTMTSTERKAVMASRAATVVLIASLAPRRDCDRVVAEQVDTG